MPTAPRAPRQSGALAVAALGVLALAACAPSGVPGPAGAGARDGAAPPEGPPILELTAADLAGRLRTGDARVTIVNVWASWCEPCREELPDVLRAARALAAEDVRLLLVSADFADALPEARAFLGSLGVDSPTFRKSAGDDMGFINVLDPAWSGTIPATFVFAADGRRVRTWEGIVRYDALVAAVRAALAEPKEEGP